MVDGPGKEKAQEKERGEEVMMKTEGFSRLKS